MAPPRGDCDEQDRRVRGTEVFVGGLPRSATEGTLREVFSTCGEIVDVRIMKDQNGNSKGYGFVQFSKREYVDVAKKQKNGFQAAARVLHIGSRTDFLLDGILHPSINWAQKESHMDDEEISKIKAAFVGNLPANVDVEYLKKLFEGFGEVERVAISRKGQYPVGFVHFARRADLDSAIAEMDGQTVRGPDRGPPFRIQVSVARPAADNDRKRIHEAEKTRRPNISRDQLDYSYERHGHGSHNRQAKAPRLSNSVLDITDSYESAIMSLPSAAKELLRRILRLRIGTQYDIDIHCIKSLNELPESSAVAVLNQFLISGGDKRNKGDYFASLIAKHHPPTFGLVHTLHGTHFPRNPEMHSKRFTHEDYDYMSSGGERYRSSEHYPSSYYADDIPMAEQRTRRYAEERPFIERNPESRLRREEIVNIRRYPEETIGYESRYNTGKLHDRRFKQEQHSKIERSPEEVGLSRDRRLISPEEAGLSRDRRLTHGAGYTTDMGPEFFSRSSSERSAARQQVRFDPFTGEPYKFDPFTGEPIRS